MQKKRLFLSLLTMALTLISAPVFAFEDFLSFVYVPSVTSYPRDLYPNREEIIKGTTAFCLGLKIKKPLPTQRDLDSCSTSSGIFDGLDCSYE